MKLIINNIDEKKIDKNNYLLSMLSHGIKCKALKSEDALRVQKEIMDILKDLIMRHTKGKSTSVTVETSEALMSSILFSIDFYLNKLKPQEALIVIKEGNIKKVYEEGLRLIEINLKDTKMLYFKVLKERLNTPLEAYNITLDEGIPIFFNKYDLYFEAHNALASIDYPLIFDDWSVKGVSYMYNYLVNFKIENDFLRLFEEKNIDEIVFKYEKMCRIYHKIELINIFEIVINNSLFSLIRGGSAFDLKIKKEELEKICCVLKNNIGKLHEKAKVLIEELNIKDINTINYINKYIEVLKKRVLRALELQTLDKIVVTDNEEEVAPEIFFCAGDKMDENSFRTLVKRIIESHSKEEKLQEINKVHSLQDFLDILRGDCLFYDEYNYIFSSLKEAEIAILINILFEDELRDGEEHINALVKEKESDEEYLLCFIEFLKKLNSERRESIEKLMKKLPVSFSEF